ncbi:MAG TPA: hypothetical protein VN612_14350 [Acidobacteriaceae bacterium]|nr:hypothetical protein [Acidobacteriaceae bacterium]
MLVSAATLAAVAINGYHPYAEDGGIYVAGVKRLLDAGLYPHDAGFAMEPSRWSLFAPMVAAIVRAVHAPLPWVLLALHVGSIWGTLYAAWMLATRCYARSDALAGVVVLLACWLGLPVAGTALYVMDPYLTARSFAIPALLVAIAGALDATDWDENPGRRWRGWMIWITGLAACAAMHPLIAMDAAAATMLLACLRARLSEVRTGGTVAVCATAIAVTACAQLFAAPESAAYVRAALSRSYWFLSEWRWYELVGVCAPVAILGAAGWISGRRDKWGCKTGAERTLAQTAVIAGLLASAVAVLFAPECAPGHLVARMQPLRMFQVVYVVMIVVLGGRLGETVLRRSVWRWAAAGLVLGAVMFASTRAEYRASHHLELPWIAKRNTWAQAFEWVRVNTPRDALFATDGDYIHAPGEDAQNFRAIAERSVLPDASKDGGEASIAPDLAKAWAQGAAAQENLNAISDAERVARLKPLGVGWVVLEASARTEFACPYANAGVRVCRLGASQ